MKLNFDSQQDNFITKQKINKFINRQSNEWRNRMSAINFQIRQNFPFQILMCQLMSLKRHFYEMFLCLRVAEKNFCFLSHQR